MPSPFENKIESWDHIKMLMFLDVSRRSPINIKKELSAYFKATPIIHIPAIDKEDLAQFHINYAMNYEKLKDIEKCNYHCEEAAKLEHSEIYAYERLIKNYIKSKDWDNALRIVGIKRLHIFLPHYYLFIH